MKVLLVEDHEHVACTTVKLLEILGHDVQHAKSGSEAIEMAEAMIPEVVLVDIGLPDIDGFSVARSLRSNEKFDSTVLVALTGYDCADKAAEAGFNHYFKKPMDYSVLPGLVSASSKT